jgi:hypothetical protein
MPETLIGNDAIVAIVLEKVELAARRAVSARYPNGIPERKDSLMQEFSEQLTHILKDMRR